jgi:flavodoxin I
MKTLIVYDSFFGNTEQIAQAIGRGLGAPEGVEVVRVGSATPDKLRGVELLIVGSPTRGFRPSEATAKFLKALPVAGLAGVKVAAFDTRVSPQDVNNRFLNFMVKRFGYAAEPIAQKLTQKGGSQVIAPEGFIVKGTEGPLKTGESERAANWAAAVAKAIH